MERRGWSAICIVLSLFTASHAHARTDHSKNVHAYRLQQSVRLPRPLSGQAQCPVTSTTPGKQLLLHASVENSRWLRTDLAEPSITAVDGNTFTNLAPPVLQGVAAAASKSPPLSNEVAGSTDVTRLDANLDEFFSFAHPTLQEQQRTPRLAPTNFGAIEQAYARLNPSPPVIRTVSPIFTGSFSIRPSHCRCGVLIPTDICMRETLWAQGGGDYLASTAPYVRCLGYCEISAPATTTDNIPKLHMPTERPLFAKIRLHRKGAHSPLELIII